MSGYVGNKKSVSFVSAELPIRKGIESIVEEDGSYRLLDGASLKKSDGSPVIHSDGTIDGVDLSPIQNQIDSIEADITSLNSSIDMVEASLPSHSMNFRNRIINGDMRIDQRNGGTAITVNGSYTVDRFRAFCPAGTFITQQVSVSGTNAPNEFDKCIKINVTSGSAPSSAQGGGFVYKIEGNDVYDFDLGLASAKTFTLSFWAKASRTGTYCCGLQSDGSDRSYVFEYELTADVWSKITETISGDITGTWLSDNGIGLDVRWSIGAGSDATASPDQWVDSSSVTTGKFQTSNQVALQTLGGDFSITGVQLEEGTVATPFEHRPISVELSLCERYWRWGKFKVGGRATTGSGNRDNIFFSTTMRVHPTVALFNEVKNGIGTTRPEISEPNHFTVYWLGSVNSDTTTYYGEYSADAEL